MASASTRRHVIRGLPVLCLGSTISTRDQRLSLCGGTLLGFASIDTTQPDGLTAGWNSKWKSHSSGHSRLPIKYRGSLTERFMKDPSKTQLIESVLGGADARKRLNVTGLEKQIDEPTRSGQAIVSTTRARSLSAVSEAPTSEELGVETVFRGASDTAT